MEPRDPPTAEEAALTDALAAMAPSDAERVLVELASALFPGGAGERHRVTWPERGGEEAAEPRPSAPDDDPARAAARLHAAEARFRTLIEQIPAVTFMAVLGEGRNDVYVSPHIEALLGFTQAEWLEDPFLWYRQLHADDRELWIAEFARGCRTGGPFLAECRFLGRDGRIVWVRGEARLVKDEHGRPMFLQGVAFDITESKRAQQILVAQAVRSTEDRYRDVVDGIGAIFWEAEATTLGFTFVSPQVETILGHPRERWLEDPAFWPTCVHPEDRDAVSGAWQAALHGSADTDVDYRCLTAAGGVVWLHSRVHVVRDGLGRPRSLLGFMVDVSERKRAEEERARLLAREQEARVEAETLHQIGRTLAGQLDLQALVQAVTDAATALTGAAFGAFFYNVRDDRGESYTLYTLSGAPREAFERFPLPRNTPLFDATFNGERIVRLDDVRTDPRYGQNPPHHGMPAGHLPVRSYLAVPVIARSGETLGGLFFGHPEPGRFTERHERMLGGVAAQAAVAMDNARLYQAAEEARRAAESANVAKDQFLATLSHELRTPLTSILGWARMLRGNQLDEATRARALEVIDQNATAQAQLIEDLLDVSRIVAGKLQIDLRPIESLGPLVEAAVEAFQPATEAKGLQLDMAVEPRAGPVSGDPDRLRQVVWNLVSNAVKFTPAGGRIGVECRRVADVVEIRVSDTGKGIAPAFVPRLFDRFTQADATSTRAQGGLGLGLSIVRHLLELHGGTIEAESRGEGHGATFTIRLPIAGPARVIARGPHLQLQLQPPRPGGRTIAGVRVLLVEDEADARDLLALILGREGAVVEAAGNAARALAIMERWRPDVLICDIGLPDEDGHALIRKIRRLPLHLGGATPAVAVTAFASQEDRESAIAAGFQEHLPKPIDPLRVVDMVARLHR